MGELKPGWKRVKFGEVVRLGKERCEPVAEGVERYIGLEHIEPGDLRVQSWGDVSDGTTFTTRVRPGHVLFGKRRAYQRKVAVADFDAVCSGDIYVFESANPAKLLPELLPFLCQTEAFFDYAVGTSAGSLSPRTNWTSLAEYEFALPPLDEQRRFQLVLSSMHAAEVAARSAGNAARAAALAGTLAAMGVDTGPRSGRLLESVRLPRGWGLAQLRDLAGRADQPVQVGPFGGSLASRHFASAGVAVLKVQNVGHDGFVDRSSFVHVADDYAATLGRYTVRADDVVVVAQGFTSGRAAIIREVDAGALISQHLIRIRLDSQRVSPVWLWCFMRSALFEEQVAPVMMKTTRPGLNTDDILDLKMPLPLVVSEQEVLAHEIGRLMASPSILDSRASDLLEQRRAFANRALSGAAL